MLGSGFGDRLHGGADSLTASAASTPSGSQAASLSPEYAWLLPGPGTCTARCLLKTGFPSGNSCVQDQESGAKGKLLCPR